MSYGRRRGEGAVVSDSDAPSQAIAPTQFNHQSTRGHCIMTLELEKPNKEDPSRKDRGRLYV